MSMSSSSGSFSRDFRQNILIDRVLAEKMQSVSENLKKVEESKQVLERSFHQARYTYAELEKMYDGLFHRYKRALGKIERLEQQLAEEVQAKELLRGENEELFCCLSGNGSGVNLNSGWEDLTVKSLRDRYETERGNLVREQMINRELVKIVEECVGRMEQRVEEKRGATEGSYQREDDSEENEMVDRVRGFLRVVCGNGKGLLIGSGQGQGEYPQSDSVKEISQHQGCNFQQANQQELMLPQLKQNTQKDEQAYLKQNLCNPYVSELLEKISERSREGFSDRSMMSGERKRSGNEFTEQNSREVKRYEMSDARSEGKGGSVVSMKDEIEKSSKPELSTQQPTAEHLYEALMEIEKKFSELVQSSAEEISESNREKVELRKEIADLEQTVIRLKEDMLEMESEVMEKMGRISRLGEELEGKVKQVREAEQEGKQKDGVIIELRKELELERDVVKELKGEVQRKEREIWEQKVENDKLKQEVMNFQEKNRKISEQLNELARKLQLSQGQKRELVKAWSEKIEYWERAALEHQNTSKLLESQISILKQEFSAQTLQQKEQNQALKQKIKDFEQIEQQLEMQNSKLQQRLNVVQGQKQKMLQQATELREQAERWRKQSQRLAECQKSIPDSECGNESFRSIDMSRGEVQKSEEGGGGNLGSEGDEFMQLKEREKDYLMQIGEKDSEMSALKNQLQRLAKREKQLTQLLQQQTKNQSNQDHQDFAILSSQFHQYKLQKQDETLRLEFLIKEKIQVFEQKLDEEQARYQEQILKLSQIIAQLQGQNGYLMLQNNKITLQFNRVYEQLSGEKDENQLMKSEIQKLNAQLLRTESMLLAGQVQQDIIQGQHNETNIKFLSNDKHHRQSINRPQLVNRVVQLQQVVQQKNADIQSLTQALQRLKSELQDAVVSYESSLQALESSHLNQIQQKQNNLKEMELQHQQQLQSLRQSYQQQILSVKMTLESLEKLYQTQQNSHNSKLLELKETHAEQMNKIYSAAQAKIGAVKKLNQKARAKLLEQEDKIKTFEYNIEQFTRLLDEKDLAIQDMVDKVRQRDGEIRELLKKQVVNERNSSEREKMERTYGQVQKELRVKINELEGELLSVREKHSKEEAVLNKVIEQLKLENDKVKRQNQDFQKAAKRQSVIINQEKLKYIQFQTRKQKLKIHALTVNTNLTPSMSLGERIQKELTSAYSPVNLLKGENYFKASKKTDLVSELTKLKRKYSQQSESRHENPIIRPTESVVYKTSPMVRLQHEQFLVTNKCLVSEKVKEEEGNMFRPILIRSSQSNVEPVTHQERKAPLRITERQVVQQKVSRDNSDEIRFNLIERKRQFESPFLIESKRKQMEKLKWQQSVPQKDVDDCEFNMMNKGNQKSQGKPHDDKGIESMKYEPRQKSSLLLQLEEDSGSLLKKDDQIQSQIQHSSHPNIHTQKAQFLENNKPHKSKQQAIGSKRLVQIKMLQDTIRRKKQENEHLLNEIKQRNNKSG